MNINPVGITIVYVSSKSAHRNISVPLHFEILQEFLMHSVNVYRFSFRQTEIIEGVTIKCVRAHPFSELPIY